jgi:hypothetical protein
MSSLQTLPKGDSAWLLRKAIERVMQQVSVLETNIGSSTTGNSNDTEIIFNDAGTLRGDKDFAWNKTSNILTIDGSATITGDLTVDTSTLKVDSTNDRVGIGTITPNQKLEVFTSTADTRVRINSTSVIATEYFRSGTGLWLVGSDSTNAFKIARGSNFGGSADYFAIASADAAATWYDAAGGTRMTLNSTGLGVGVSPAFKIHANGVIGTTNTFGAFTALQTAGGTGYRWTLANDNNFYLQYSPDGFGSTATSRIALDSSGNVGVGVTPSAWATYKAVSVGGIGASVFGLGSSQAGVAQGAFFNNGAGSGWAYSATSQVPTYYLQINGENIWNIAASGTAGAQITAWTPAMKLDASGNLLVGTTAPLSGNAAKFHLSTDSGTTRWAVGPYSSATNFIISAVGGSGVYLNGTAATSWTSASDERLKDIIEPITNAVSKVASLRAVIGKFKFDENNTRKPFLIAQDVQAVLPEAVDASNPDRLGVSYTDVIPLLVASIKELTTRVQTIEAR